MSGRPPPVESLVELEGAAVAFYPAGAAIGPRLLTSFEIVLLVSGGAILTLDDQHVALAPGNCVLAGPV